MPAKTNKAHTSVKHDIIDRDNSRIVVAVAIAVFLVVFCGFALRTLFSQSLYHGRVIDEKTKTLRQLEDNQEALSSLEQSYLAFVNESENILGGSPSGDGPLDGDNAKVVLDALPGVYDYPALTSSFEKILKEGGYEINSLGGSEDASIQNVATNDVTPISIPYTFSFSSSVDGAEALLGTLQRSIRPMHVTRLNMTVNQNGSITTDVTLNTFFTQEKTFDLGSKEVQ